MESIGHTEQTEWLSHKVVSGVHSFCNNSWDSSVFSTASYRRSLCVGNISTENAMRKLKRNIHCCCSRFTKHYTFRWMNNKITCHSVWHSFTCCVPMVVVPSCRLVLVRISRPLSSLFFFLSYFVSLYSILFALFGVMVLLWLTFSISVTRLYICISPAAYFFFLVRMLLCKVSISLGSIQFRPGECVMSFNERHYYEIYWCGSSLELYGSKKDLWPREYLPTRLYSNHFALIRYFWSPANYVAHVWSNGKLIVLSVSLQAKPIYSPADTLVQHTPTQTSINMQNGSNYT